MKRHGGHFLTGSLLAPALVALFGAAGCQKGGPPQGAAAPTPHAEPVVTVAAPGRVEPHSEEIKVGAELDGKLREVSVEEGDEVVTGQLLAVLENRDYEAQLASATSQIAAAESQRAAALARLEQARAEMSRIVNGARVEERKEARAAVEQAVAVRENARTEFERRKLLVADGDIPREELERAERDLRVAEARERELRERFAVVNAAARQEDVARAAASVRLMEAQIREAESRIREAHARAAEARAMLNKTQIRSPITGVVLRKHLKAGESVSASPNMPVVTVGDTMTLRVRADVDEADVGKLKVGQRAYMTAQAYGDRKFWGRVARIGQLVGRKNFRTDEPAERADTKILETLIDLDPDQRLPPGLRVDTYIVVSGSPPEGERPPSN